MKPNPPTITPDPKPPRRAETIERVRTHQAHLKNLGVISLYLFGSVARDQATSESDIDILVELERSVGYFEFFTIQHYLEDLLQHPIDLGTKDALKEHLREPVLEDSIYVF